jgi:hypothetical protein
MGGNLLKAFRFVIDYLDSAIYIERQMRLPVGMNSTSQALFWHHRVIVTAAKACAAWQGRMANLWSREFSRETSC